MVRRLHHDLSNDDHFRCESSNLALGHASLYETLVDQKKGQEGSKPQTGVKASIKDEDYLEFGQQLLN